MEQTHPLVDEGSKDRFVTTIEQRMDEMNTEAKRKRLVKIVQKIAG